MPINKLGKIMFPHMDRWQRRREIKMIFLAILAGLFLAGLVALAMFLKNPPLSH